jgi:3-hydroxybutyryl-CoA dehydrogenase
MKNAWAEKPSMDFINMTNVIEGNLLINFGFASKEDKKKILQDHPDKDIFMDLSTYDPEEFYKEFSNLKGAFAALFCDQAKKMEIHFREDNDAVITKLQDLGFSPVRTSIISCGFIFPRTIAQIINEAHFALEEEVASREDINRAMKFGVNYPQGPFEWSAGKEVMVVTLLEELYAKTKDKRYLPSALLKK